MKAFPSFLAPAMFIQVKIVTAVLVHIDNFDLPKDHLAFLTTLTVDCNMESKVLEHIKGEFPKGFARMLVDTTRVFGPTAIDFYPPRYFNILNTKWNRSGYPSVKFNK